MQVHTWFQSDSAHANLHDFCGGSAATYSQKSPDKETENEDAAALIEFSSSHGILAVADGVGGQNAGDRAARTTIESILKFCRKHCRTNVNVSGAGPGTSIRAVLLDAIEAANREVLDWGIGAGTTLVVAEYLNGKLRIIHVGDTGALVCSNRGRIKFFAVAHAPVALALELGLMNESEALSHEDRNIISNCVGFDKMKIEVGPELVLAQRDSLVIATDGLFDNLTTDEIIRVMRAGPMRQKLDELAHLARSRMLDPAAVPSKPDDLTVVSFRKSPASLGKKRPAPQAEK